MKKIKSPKKICCNNVLKYFYIFFFILFVVVSFLLYSFLEKYVYAPIFSAKFLSASINNTETSGVDVLEFSKIEEKVNQIEKNLEFKKQRKEFVNFRNIFR